MKKEYFDIRSESDAFVLSFNNKLSEISRASRNKYISPENELKFSHGISWQSPASNNDEGPSEMQLHRVEHESKFEDVVNNDIQVLLHSIHKIAQEMEKQFAESMFGMINETCNKSGNVVSGQAAGGNAAAFLQMMERIEFGVDNDGNVSLPSIFVSPEMGAKFIADLEAQPEEYKERIEAIKAMKTAKAQQENFDRKSKFIGWRANS